MYNVQPTTEPAPEDQSRWCRYTEWCPEGDDGDVYPKSYQVNKLIHFLLLYKKGETKNSLNTQEHSVSIILKRPSINAIFQYRSKQYI